MTASTLGTVRDMSRQSRLLSVRLENAAAELMLDGLSQTAVAQALGVSQPAVSQMLRRRRERTIGSRWTIPALAARLTSRPEASIHDVLRDCAQFCTDFRALTDDVDREQALGAPESTSVQRFDCLIAGLADYEARRAGIPTPSWAISRRYDMFPSWFVVPHDNLTAYVMRVSPPEFSVRGVFLDPRDLESV